MLRLSRVTSSGTLHVGLSTVLEKQRKMQQRGSNKKIISLNFSIFSEENSQFLLETIIMSILSCKWQNNAKTKWMLTQPERFSAPNVAKKSSSASKLLPSCRCGWLIPLAGLCHISDPDSDPVIRWSSEKKLLVGRPAALLPEKTEALCEIGIVDDLVEIIRRFCDCGRVEDRGLESADRDGGVIEAVIGAKLTALFDVVKKAE